MSFELFEQLSKALKELGLNTSDINVYLSLLSLGSNPASTISKHSGLNRSACYIILERLISKGFVKKTMKNNVMYYGATDPNTILEHLKQKNESLEEKIDILSETIKTFKQYREKNGVKPKITFYEGVDSIKKVIETTLQTNDILRAYASLDLLNDLLPEYMNDYYKQRTKKGIHVKAIYPTTKLSLSHQKRDKQELRESILIPQQLDLKLDIMIFDDKIAVTSLSEKFGVLIESKEMAKEQKQIFDTFWVISKRIKHVNKKSRDNDLGFFFNS